MINYVVGFMFNLDKTKVALIRKNRPEWQNGLLNGIGGKNNDGEHSLSAMTREFEEETGVKTFWYDWWPITTLTAQNKKWQVDVYWAIGLLDNLKNTTDEKIEIIDVTNIDNEKTISNIPWLIKMCLDKQVIFGQIKCR